MQRMYNIWACMKQRCLNEKAPNYCRYGGRGINICEEWLKFENFKKDMKDSFEPPLPKVRGFLFTV